LTVLESIETTCTKEKSFIWEISEKRNRWQDILAGVPILILNLLNQITGK
jgi:hypothetical protein